MNLSNFAINESALLVPDFLYPSNQVIFIEELCKPYIQSVSKVYLTVAIFNIFYSFVWLFLKNRQDKVIFRIPTEFDEGKPKTYVFTVGNVVTMLDTMFFILNFFVIGYWLLIHNVEFVIKLPFVKWFT